MGEFKVNIDVCKFCPRFYSCNREKCSVESFEVELDYKSGFAKIRMKFKD